MTKFASTVAIAAALIAAAAPAVATTIDFEGVSGDVGEAYAAQGVHFANTIAGVFGAYPGSSGITQVYSGNGGTAPGPATAMVASFDFDVTNVSITGIDIGQAGMQLSSYDVGGSLLSTQTFYGTGIGVGTFHTLTLTDTGIRSVQFSQANPCCGDGAIFDTLTFDADEVPEPAMLGLFGLGAIGLGLSRRRRG